LKKFRFFFGHLCSIDRHKLTLFLKRASRRKVAGSVLLNRHDIARYRKH